MLQLLSLIQCPRLKYQTYPLITNAHFRNMCCGCKKSGCDCDSKGGKEKEQKDERLISGGSVRKNDNEEDHCMKLLIERDAKKKQEADKTEGAHKLLGGSQICRPRPSKKITESTHENSTRWKRITFLGALPLIALLTAFVFTSHHEKERPEFKKWAYMYQRHKPFHFGDGNRSAFHNSYWNPLPPDGYEDEIDVEANGKTPETEKERAERLKEFAEVEKVWKKHDATREAAAKKAQAAAEKEAQRQQIEAEKEEKRQLAEEAKELKRQQAEEEMELKRQLAEEAKLKHQEEEAEKEAELKQQGNDAKNAEFAFSEKENENEK